MEPQLFTVIREADESGVSGTGRVLDGVLWHNGRVTICWRTDIGKHGYSSIGHYESWEAFEFIHIQSHPKNNTKVVWIESDEPRPPDTRQEERVGSSEKPPLIRMSP